jgi:hypothetical protein
MTDRYENIRKALAMGPTPGPWGLKELPRDMQRDGYKFSISRRGLGCWIAKVTHEANGGSGAANAAYITACDPDTIRELLKERDALAKLAMEMRGTLRDLRIHLHAAGRRPEECYEMSMIDDALDYERSHDALNGGGE